MTDLREFSVPSKALDFNQTASDFYVLAGLAKSGVLALVEFKKELESYNIYLRAHGIYSVSCIFEESREYIDEQLCKLKIKKFKMSPETSVRCLGCTSELDKRALTKYFHIRKDTNWFEWYDILSYLKKQCVKSDSIENFNTLLEEIKDLNYYVKATPIDSYSKNDPYDISRELTYTIPNRDGAQNPLYVLNDQGKYVEEFKNGNSTGYSIMVSDEILDNKVLWGKLTETFKKAKNPGELFHWATIRGGKIQLFPLNYVVRYLEAHYDELGESEREKLESLKSLQENKNKKKIEENIAVWKKGHPKKDVSEEVSDEVKSLSSSSINALIDARVNERVEELLKSYNITPKTQNKEPQQKETQQKGKPEIKSECSYEYEDDNHNKQVGKVKCFNIPNVFALEFKGEKGNFYRVHLSRNALCKEIEKVPDKTELGQKMKTIAERLKKEPRKFGSARPIKFRKNDGSTCDLPVYSLDVIQEFDREHGINPISIEEICGCSKDYLTNLCLESDKKSAQYESAKQNNVKCESSDETPVTEFKAQETPPKPIELDYTKMEPVVEEFDIHNM